MQPVDVESQEVTTHFSKESKGNQQGKHDVGKQSNLMLTLSFVIALGSLACFFIIIFLVAPTSPSSSVTPSTFETTASFKYTHGQDIEIDGLLSITHETLKSKKPSIGCVTFEDVSKPIGRRDIKKLCLTSPDRVQTVRFKAEELLIPQDVEVSTGLDVFISLHKDGVPFMSLYDVTDKGIWSHPFDEIEVTYIKDHVYSDESQVMVELNGPINIPAPCVLFSTVDHLATKDVSSFLICGKTGDRSVVMNSDRFADIGIDMKKLSSDFSYVRAGALSSIKMYTENNFKGPMLQVESKEKLNMHDRIFTSLSTADFPSGELKRWSEGLKGFTISFK